MKIISKVKKISMWCILCVITWSPIKSKKKSNIFKIDRVVSTKLSPESQERSSKIELRTIGSLFGTVLLVKCALMRINRTTNCTLGNESVFTKPLKK